MAVVRATRLAVADMARRRAPGAIIMINRCSSFEFILTMLERECYGSVVRATRLAVADMARRRAPGAIIMINRCSSFEFILTMLERECYGSGEGDAAGRRGHARRRAPAPSS
ncbi:hypothetical protein EVAR_43744_1 [Eumeta japonica]|uniref:Uncharacterized protein n=1 Tax=Eumeta variegata TaxID=151549 RepID=A0A4C1Y0S5_EUMVA|nr:hypothetical protein EVAR_43744_1 [Eumeta japonica]